jgi:diguanylate cyclase
MTIPADEHERTLAFAHIALGQIKALRQPADPRHYELWYTYATGYSPSLNQKINETLARTGSLSESDINHLHDTYISPNRSNERLDRVGSQVVGEIDQVMAMIEAAAGTASSYSENLADVTQKLRVAMDAPAVRAIVESLIQATKEIEQTNATLEASLNASKREITQLQESLEAIRNESMTDPLTSLANRKHFDNSLTKAIAEARSENQHLSLLITDVDFFKKFNDRYGHLTGDQVLRLVAASVKQTIKGMDVAARYGGEEFAILLPNTILDDAMIVAEHIRSAVMSKELMKKSTGEHLGRVTISVGVATLHPADTAQTLIERADNCLYAAKRGGRNKVVSEADLVLPGNAAPQVA